MSTFEVGCWKKGTFKGIREHGKPMGAREKPTHRLLYKMLLTTDWITAKDFKAALKSKFILAPVLNVVLTPQR